MKKILIIDDNIRGRKLLLEVLQKAGYDATEAEEGTEGVYLAKKVLPGIILLDVAMADVDGIEVCKRLKEINKVRNVPIVMLSGMDDKRLVDMAIKAGAVDFLFKPFQAPELLSKVGKYIV